MVAGCVDAADGYGDDGDAVLPSSIDTYVRTLETRFFFFQSFSQSVSPFISGFFSFILRFHKFVQPTQLLICVSPQTE